MEGYLRSIITRVGSDLGYDSADLENMSKAIRVVQTSLTVGVLFSANMYFWINSLSLISLVAGSLSTYILYCQIISLYCQARLLQNPTANIEKCQREVSLIKSYMLSKAYTNTWYLIDYMRLSHVHHVQAEITSAPVSHQATVPTFVN